MKAPKLDSGASAASRACSANSKLETRNSKLRSISQFRTSAVSQFGFTLIELMIVMAIIAILLNVAVISYKQSIITAKESALRQDLSVIRSAIDQYTLDKKKAPQNLQDLVEAGYLKTIPKDPITGSSETWQLVNEDVSLSVDQTQPGISDVKSGAQGSSSDGTPYSDW